ncbi:hypothetical protein LIER_12368 [Lithospermum erythrorhizon]|uniref:Reverse transcriptase/retrotransposon-derived protein RNase H-like domain-containing protein n=1 Tax=Lithospermum erythrorhizon TaxID=34254 RepID=A0AAV3PVL1_LITER
MEPPTSYKEEDPQASKELFLWDSECDKAFKELKDYLGSPKLLTRPEGIEELQLYLTVSEGAVSSVLVKEKESTQKPISYVSHVLHGAEESYPLIDKFVFAIVITAKKLKAYFESHHIKVLTDQPIKRITSNPSLTGRLTTWAIELSEFEGLGDSPSLRDMRRDWPYTSVYVQFCHFAVCIVDVGLILRYMCSGRSIVTLLWALLMLALYYGISAVVIRDLSIPAGRATWGGSLQGDSRKYGRFLGVDRRGFRGDALTGCGLMIVGEAVVVVDDLNLRAADLGWVVTVPVNEPGVKTSQTLEGFRSRTKKSMVAKGHLRHLREHYSISPKVRMRVPMEGETVDAPLEEGYTPVFWEFFNYGMRLRASPFFPVISSHFQEYVSELADEYVVDLFDDLPEDEEDLGSEEEEDDASEGSEDI